MKYFAKYTPEGDCLYKVRALSDTAAEPLLKQGWKELTQSEYGSLKPIQNIPVNTLMDRVSLLEDCMAEVALKVYQ